MILHSPFSIPLIFVRGSKILSPAFSTNFFEFSSRSEFSIKYKIASLCSSKISGIEKGECKIIPAFNITSDYVILANLPDDLRNNNKNIFKNLIYNVFCEMKKFEIHSLNIDYSFLTEKYSSEFVNLINEVIDEKSLRISDFLVFMCKS